MYILMNTVSLYIYIYGYVKSAFGSKDVSFQNVLLMQWEVLDWGGEGREGEFTFW